MQNTLSKELNMPALYTTMVAEQQEQYVDRFDQAVNEFNLKLNYIDKRSVDPTTSPDELLLVTTKAIMKMADACEEFERNCLFDKKTIKQAQLSFRERTGAMFSKSYFMNRARTWPQGYAGDFQTLEGIYRNIPLSNGVGLYLDRYFLATTLPSAVRDRKDFLRDLLRRELNQRQEPKILDIACGSCRELVELAPEIRSTKAKVTCVDFDPDALGFAADRMAFAGLPQEHTTFRKYNALKMTNHDRNLKEFGPQDVIYSVGFFDYLQDVSLVPLLSSLYALLNPGGTLIMSFKDCRRYRAQEYSWFVDWDGFLQRTEEDSREVLVHAGIPLNSVTSARDSSGVIIFFNAAR